MNFFHFSLTISICVHIICQLFKLIYYSIKNRKLKMSYFFSPGGMPSTHTAFTSTLTISLGLIKGFNSAYFAITFVFSAVVIYDSLRLRGAVQLHAEMIKKLMKLLPEKERSTIPQMVGHTLSEIIVGIIVAIVFSLGFYYLFGDLFLQSS
ncbi:MAG: divergent PAP2 family protein [Spirochaetales bacterium]|nr:divergent PAP2 family protein [Spirochaetales bacterium]